MASALPKDLHYFDRCPTTVGRSMTISIYFKHLYVLHSNLYLVNNV